MNNPRKRDPKKIAVIDPERCFGAFSCSICQAACPVEDCIIEEPDEYGRWGLRRPHRQMYRVRSLRDVGQSNGGSTTRLWLPCRLRCYQYDGLGRRPPGG